MAFRSDKVKIIGAETTFSDRGPLSRYRVSFPVVKQPVRGLEERVELHIYCAIVAGRRVGFTFVRL
jgi:hypothetical protein